MINIFEVNETNKMIEQENTDVYHYNGESASLDCIDSDLAGKTARFYEKLQHWQKIW